MNNTQQIEEIARILCGADKNDNCDCQHCTLLTSCFSMEDATRLYNAGFRKFNPNINFYTVERRYNDYEGYYDYTVVTPSFYTHSFTTEEAAKNYLSSIKSKSTEVFK